MSDYEEVKPLGRSPCERWGPIFPATERIAMEAAAMGRRNAVWPRLWPEVVELVRFGDRLRGVETRWLADWLEEIGRQDLEPEDVQTVQFSREWASSKLGGSPQSATRAISQLVQIGLLAPVRKGEKNHATLYCVNPLPSRFV